ncbi:MAG: GspH/FimT family pseudopilin [Phycisphaerales bacterium]|nr:MAG: GspH/FimT family pseudopilin [Phycisphaerales bacterium]
MPDLAYLPNWLRKRCTEDRAGKDSPNSRNGFTVIEILILAVLLTIVALTAVPMLSSAGTMQLRAAANMIAADLEYAKNMAISRGQNYSVVFDQNSDGYQIEDQNNNVVPHPVKKGFDYIVDFQSDSRLSTVDITGADFAATADVAFDSLGSPDSGGTVTLQASGTTVTITVEPITGYISIQ